MTERGAAADNAAALERREAQGSSQGPARHGTQGPRKPVPEARRAGRADRKACPRGLANPWRLPALHPLVRGDGKRDRTPRVLNNWGSGALAKCADQVPTASGECILRSAAITDSATFLPVFGFSDGMFSIDSVKRELSESTSMVWQFRVTAGSAQMSIMVRSGPMPASESAAATLTLAGNPAAASRAVPLNTSFAVFRPSTEMLCLTRYGAPTSPFGGFRVVIFTEWMVPSAAAATASRPSSAPVGTRMRPPLALARSIRSGRGSSAPQDSTITCLPASSIGRQMRSRSEAGAHSIARSACLGNSSSSTTGQSMFCSFSQSRALPALPVAMQASESPGRPSVSRRATARPIAPRPAMAMRVGVMLPPYAKPAQRGNRRCRMLDREPPVSHLSGNQRRRPMLRTVVSAFAGLLVSVAAVQAQNFPTRSVTMVIPFAAGGPTDVLGRVVAAKMGEALGQTVVVENVTGAGGQTGSKRVADSPPDGYNVVVGTVGTHAQAQTLYKKPLYNSQTDFTPVGLIAQVPIVLIARKDLPVKDMKEFVAYAKENQKKMQFGSAGAGSATHLGCVLLNYLIGVDITHVPYRGTGPAMQDLAAGRIDYLCEIITTAKPQIDGGTVKAIAIFDSKKSKALPNLATAEEQGTKDLIAYTWNAVFAPKNTPQPVVQKLNGAMIRAMHATEVKDRLGALGAEIAPDDQATPDHLAKLVKDEIEKWAKPIKASGV